MQPAAHQLAAQHGDTVDVWRQRLQQAGLPIDLPMPLFTPGQRAALKRILQRLPKVIAPPTPIPATTAPQQPVIPSELRQWARMSLAQYLRQWQPWLMAGIEPSDHENLNHAKAFLGNTLNWQAPPPPVPLPPTDSLLQALRQQQAFVQLAYSQQLVLLLLFAASRHPDVASVIGALAPRTRRHGWPLLLLTRIAAPNYAGCVQLPNIWVQTQRIAGQDLCRLLPWRGQIAGPRGGQSQPAPTAVQAVERSANLASRLPALPADILPLHLGPYTEASLRDLRLRWQFRNKLGTQASGVIGLFSGPPGHGRRTAARKLAADLGLELFLVSPALLASKWIGETEQRISQLFGEIKRSGAALMLEDAQDLLTARVAVTGANDRYANLSVNHLLQEVESFPGLLLLVAPNLASLDAAMRRRIHVTVRFDEVSPDQRAGILRCAYHWLQAKMPAAGTTQEDPDFHDLAQLSLTPADLTRACFDAALQCSVRGVPLDGEALAASLQRRLGATAGLVRQGAAQSR